jgi:SOS-response transcriptional repressor LexA
MREIAKGLGCSSLGAINQHLWLIEKKGYLRRAPGYSRAITLVDDSRPADNNRWPSALRTAGGVAIQRIAIFRAA